MSFLNRFLADQPRDDTLASVVRNLQHLLSSPRGYGSPLGSFGIADYLGEQGGRNTALTVMREIRDTADLYEPRLRVDGMTALGRDAALWLHIELRGVLLLTKKEKECCLRILFQVTTGAVRVEADDGP